MPVADPVLSILIVNWNTRKLLARCLDSLDQHPPDVPFEVIVVDNASSDGSAAMVRKSGRPVRLVENRENVGFAAANNQAIGLSRGRYLLLLNPDTEVKPQALAGMVGYLEAYGDVGGVGPRLLNPDGTHQISCFPAPTLAREFWRLFHLDALHPLGTYPQRMWRSGEPLDVEVIQGACLMLRRAALEEVGLLDERYYIYSEEVDLCLRLRRAGWRLVWLPGAQVVHYGGQSTRQASVPMFLHLYRSKVLYFRKHRGRLAAGVYKAILFLAALPRLLFGPLTRVAPARGVEGRPSLERLYLRLILALPRM